MELNIYVNEYGNTRAKICVGNDLRFDIFMNVHVHVICLDNPAKIPGYMLTEIAEAFEISVDELSYAAQASYEQLMWEVGTENVLARYPWIAELV